MIPLLALASLLAGATYFGLPDMGGDDDDRQADDAPDLDPDVGGGDLLDTLPTDATQTEGQIGAGMADMLYQGFGDLQTGDAQATDTQTGAVSADPTAPSVADTDAGPDAPQEDASAAPAADASDYGTFRTVTGSDADDTLRAGHADTLDGGDGDDTLLGYRGDDHLIGGAGNDLLRAGGGDNFLEGGDGSDLLLGVETHADLATGLEWMLTPATGPSHDVLDGGDGDDVLRMGHGDTGIGGAGSDIFEVHGESATSDEEVPVIKDFDPDHDRLVLAVPFSEEQIIAAWPDTPEHTAEVSVVDFEDGTGASIFVDGEIVAHVTGAQGLDPGAITLSGTDIIGPDIAQLDAVGEGDMLWHGLPAAAAGPRA